MFIKEPKTFYDAIKPLVYFNCFLGMGAYRQPNQSDSVYFRMQVHTVIITLVNWTTLYIGLNSIGEVLDFESASPMARVMYKVLVYTNSCISLFAPLLVWFRRKGMGDCCRQMLVLDHTLQTLLGAPKEYRRLWIRLTCQVIGIVAVMLLVNIYDTLWSLEMKLQINFRSVVIFSSIAMTLHNPILVMLLLDVNFCTFLRYLGEKFRDLNDGLLEMAGKSSTISSGERRFIVSHDLRMRLANEISNKKTENLMNDNHYLLQEIRKAYLEVCKLSRKINLAFGIQNLLSTGISFVMVTGLLYTIYSAFSREVFTYCSLKEVLPSAIWAAIYAFKIWMVNHYCWSVSSEAQRTGEVIYELFKPKMDERLGRDVSNRYINEQIVAAYFDSRHILYSQMMWNNTRIKEFGVQMLQNPVRFDACGFFTLDYTFVQGVIGSITTYLVILIQMSNVSVSTASDSLVNGTIM